MFDFNKLISIAVGAELIDRSPLRRRLVRGGRTPFQRVQTFGKLSGNGFVVVPVLVESVVLVAVRTVPTIPVAVRDDRVFVAEPTINADREARPQKPTAESHDADPAGADDGGGDVLGHPQPRLIDSPEGEEKEEEEEEEEAMSRIVFISHTRLYY